MNYTVGEIARHIQGEVVGDGSLQIEEVTTIDKARTGSLVFAQNAAFFRKAEDSNASCIIVDRSQPSSRKTLILVDHPRLAFAKVLGLYHPPKVARPGVHPSSVIGENVRLGSEVSIGPFVVIGDRVQIGDRAVIGPLCVIGDGCVIGSDSVLRAHVTLYDRVFIGCGVSIHAGAVIGSDGFGYTPEAGRPVKIPQVGDIIIEDEVEVGANVCVDRATLGSTIIRRGVKIDNLVQIAHNVIVGEGSLIVGQVGISGSSTLGRGCVLGGQAGIADHVTLGDRVIVGAQSGIASGKRLKNGEIVWGSPARPIQKTKRQIAALAQLPELLKEVSQLRKIVDELQSRVQESGG
jgi:UDP-3-O-[3-hydroxymyristoyl] glucosamine N-acyltransferase